MNVIDIGGRKVGEQNAAFIIAEIAQAHDGSLGAAHAYIDALAEAGVDAVKFQTHIADCESTLDEAFRVKFSLQDETRYDYWKRMEFSLEQWVGLAKHANDKGLAFLSTPFSMAALDMLIEIGVPAWKVGSGEFRSLRMLERMGNTGKPLLVSSGMSSMAEISDMVSWLTDRNYGHALFQCTSSYPVGLDNVGINVISDLRRFHCPVGLSDHSGSLFPGLLALADGASLLEVHAVFDKRMFGPDVSSSLTIEEIAFLVKARDAFEKMRNSPVDKNAMADNLKGLREIFTKSIALVEDQPDGVVLEESMLTEKKPGTGIAYVDRDRVIGKKLIKNVSRKKLLQWTDLESNEE